MSNNITQTFLIECNRENSVEIKNFGVDNPLSSRDTAEWTNILKNCNLKKGDILQMDNAVINARGSNTDAMEFTGLNVDSNRLYTDNFAIMKFAHWLSDNNEYSCGLPFSCFEDDGTTEKTCSSFVNVNNYQPGGITTNFRYGMFDCPTYDEQGIDYQYLFNSPSLPGPTGRTGGFPLTTAKGIDARVTNFNNVVTCNKYGKLNVLYMGHMRPSIDPAPWNADLLTGEVKINIGVGYEDPNNVADTFTQAFLQTQPQGESLQLMVNPLTAAPGLLDLEQEAVLTGELMKSISVNGQIRDDLRINGSPVSLGSRDGFYQGLCVDEPIRFSNGVNILLQSELLDVGTDITAFKSPARQTPNFNCTMITASGAVAFEWDNTLYPYFKDTLRIGQILELITPNGAVIAANTTITGIAYGSGVLSSLMTVDPVITNGSNLPVMSTVIKCKGVGEFVSNIPVYLFANNPGQNENGWDEYSPHTDNDEFDLKNMTFTGSGLTFTFEKVGYTDFGAGNLEYNYIIKDAGGVEIYKAEWTGNNGNAPQNYFIFGTTSDYYTFEFSYDNDTKTLRVPPDPDLYAVYDYDQAICNPWLNQAAEVREFTNAVGHYSVYDAVLRTTYYAYPSFGKQERVEIKSYYGHQYGVATLNSELTQLTISPAITIYNLDGVLFDDPARGYVIEYVKVIEQQQGGNQINYLITKESDGTIVGYMYFNGILNNTENKVFDTLGVEIDESFVVNYVNSGLSGSFIVFTNNSTLTTNTQTWTTPSPELLANNEFAGYVAPTMPSWTLNPSHTDFDAGLLAAGIVQRNSGSLSSVKQTLSSPLVVGQEYDIVLNRSDAGASAIYVRTKNGVGNVNVLWDNGSTSSLRVIATGGQNLDTPTVYFEVLTACDGLEIYLDQTGEGINFAKLQLRGGGGGGSGTAISIINDSIWTTNLSNPLALGYSFTALTSTDDAINLDNIYANMPTNQIIPTNIKYNKENLAMLEKFFKGTEKYTGDATNIDAINSSTANWEVLMDNGRSRDDIWSSTNLVTTFQTQANCMVFSWQPYQAGNPDGVFVSPMLTTDVGVGQQFAVFSRWLKDANTRLKYGASLPTSPEVNLNSQAFSGTQKFYLNNPVSGEQYDDSLSQALNIAVYPCWYLKQNDSDNPPSSYSLERVCCFELKTDMRSPQNTYLKTMWGTAAMFSPQMADHNQIIALNNECSGADTYIPADTPPDPAVAFVKDIEAFNNYIYVGAEDMTCSYNNSLGRFQFLDWHVPRFLNSGTGATDQLGSSICSFLSSSQGIPLPILNVYPTFINNTNPNLNDLQCGNMLLNIFLQTENITLSDSTDVRAIEMTRNNFYGSLFWKMGFVYEDLFPIRFVDKPFKNRFNQYNQNQYNNLNARLYTTTPLSTNSDINIGAITSLSIYPGNEAYIDSSTTATLLGGKPKFGLGGNNTFPVNVQVESASITASNLQVELNNGFYRVYCDLPMSCFNYVGAEQDLPAIGVCLRNYSTGGFFYGYATSYEIQITKDMPLNSIRTIIRDGNGKVARNLNEKCCIFYKVSRSIPIGEQRSNETIVLEEILKQLKENSENLTNQNAEISEQLEQLALPQEQRAMVNNIENEILDQVIDNIITVNSKGIVSNPEKAARNVVSFFDKNKVKIKQAIDVFEGAVNKQEKRQALELLKNYIPNFNFKIGDLNKPQPFKIRNREAVDILKERLYNPLSTATGNRQLIKILKSSFQQMKVLYQDMYTITQQIQKLRDIPLAKRSSKERMELKDLIYEKRQMGGEEKVGKRQVSDDLRQFRLEERKEVKQMAKERGITQKEANRLVKQRMIKEGLRDKPLGRRMGPMGMAKIMEEK